MRHEEVIQGVFHIKAQNSGGGKIRRTTNGRTRNQLKAPTSNKMILFRLVHTAKKQTTLQKNVGGGLTSSAENVVSWSM